MIYFILFFSVCFFIISIINFFRQLHVCQLFLYRPALTFGFFLNNKLIFLYIFSFIILLFACVLTQFFYYNFIIYVCGLILIVAFLCYSITLKKQKQILKRNFTKRAKRFFVVYILFWAMFSLVIIVHTNMGLQFNIMYILIFTLLYHCNFYISLLASILIEYFILQKYALKAKSKLKRMPELITICLTGSYGKTSTKEFLFCMLEKSFNVLKTPNSYNTKVGIIKTINNELKPYHQIFICEMGADKLHDIKKLCKIVKPEFSILTSVGNQHLKTFKTLSNIIKTKYEIVECLTKGGKSFFNCDNEIVNSLYLKTKGFKYSVGFNKDFDCYINNIKTTRDGLSFNICLFNKILNLKTRLLGIHNVINIAISATVASVLGVKHEDIVNVVSLIKPVKNRLELIKKEQGVIINDSFNSNEVGFKNAVDVLTSLENKPKILVTPGVVELKEKAYEINFGLANYAGNKIDELIIISNINSKALHDGAIKGGTEPIAIKKYNTFLEAQEYIKIKLKSGASVLIENDLPDNYYGEEI